MYKDTEARNLIIEAGNRLVEEGLVARTWGNISARCDAYTMIITPSGLEYGWLKPEDLCAVRIVSTRDYYGEYSPSSESKLHAMVYMQHPEYNFIIHTHQLYASAISVAGKGTPMSACAKYGLPGTGMLVKAVSKCIENNRDKDCILLARHGALCGGATYEEAFDRVEKLEAECKEIFEKAVGEGDFYEKCLKSMDVLPAYLDDFAQMFSPKLELERKKENLLTGKDITAKEMILDKNCAAALYAKKCGGKPLGIIDATLQNFIYKYSYSEKNDEIKKG